MKKNFYFIPLILTILLLCVSMKLMALSKGDNDMIEWKDFGKWYEWKSKQKLNQTQREVIDYLKYINKIYEDTMAFWEKEFKAENITAIDNSINAIEDKTPPELCKTYKMAILNHLNLIRKYYELKNRGYVEDSEEIQKINKQILKAEAQPFCEFFNVLKAIGLFDNYEKEISEIISEEKK